MIAQMVPGARPLEEVEAVVSAAADLPIGLASCSTRTMRPARRTRACAIMPNDGRLFLVIDQFEELFTVTDELPRRRFLHALASAVAEPDGQIIVLLALRADYYDRPLLHPEFARSSRPGVDERPADDGE